MKASIFSLLIFFIATSVFSQRVPSLSENIEFLVTFSPNAPTSWGDDDFTQIYFLSISKNYTQPFYVRIFDADLGGKHDAANGAFDSKTVFELYGGNQAYSNAEARSENPEGNFDSGIKIFSEEVGVDPNYDDQWMTIGPINPKEGEFDEALNANVFKLIIKGASGNDGNLYNFFISSSATANIEVPSANAFCYEMTFRVPKEANRIPHLYPFVDDKVISVRVQNFDFDGGGGLRLTSVAKNENRIKQSGDDDWAMSEHTVSEKERNTSFDIHIVNSAKFSNDMTIFVTNQYDEVLPFFAKPINGIPKYKYKIGVSLEEK
jgi:hypothetical protein